MYTTQVQNLTAALSRVATPQQTQAIIQSLANCAQPLTTRGTLTVDGAASSAPPRGGVFTAPPNYGGLSRGQPTGNTLQDWAAGNYQQSWPRLGSDVWNNQFFNRLGDNAFYSGDNNYWGGDTLYGDNYLANNNVINNQAFINNILQNYNASNNFFNSINNNNSVNNLTNWYNQTFQDNSVNDFSTQNNFTTNQYSQTINSFGGDSYFDNTYTEGDTYNNNVTTYGAVINEGDVYNNGNTYLTGNTYITNEGNVEEITQYITEVVGGNVTTVPVYRWTFGAIRVPSNAISGGTVTVTLTPATTVIKNVTKATLDTESCEVTLTSSDVEVVTGVTATAKFEATAAALNPEAVITTFGEAGRIPVLAPG